MTPLGAQPLFLEVAPASRTVPLAEVERAVRQGARAVVVTHLYGLAAPDIGVIAGLCAAHGVRLIEDCAQVHGARIHGRCVGSFGDAASFSFYPTKNLGALRDGGAVATRHADVADALVQLRHYGWTSKYTVSRLGARNSRLDELQAAVLSALLSGLDADNARRRRIPARYRRAASRIHESSCRSGRATTTWRTCSSCGAIPRAGVTPCASTCAATASPARCITPSPTTGNPSSANVSPTCICRTPSACAARY